MAPKLLRPTSGADWRRPRTEGELIELPSGNRARLRAVSLPTLVAAGNIPDLLTPLVVRMLGQGIDATTDTLEKALASAEKGEDDAGAAEAFRQLRDMNEVFDAVCRAIFVEPRIVETPQADDEIAAEDLELADKLHAVYLAMQPVEVLRRFRVQPATDVATVHDGEDLQSTPVSAAGDC